jgi:hypothetical protein
MTSSNGEEHATFRRATHVGLMNAARQAPNRARRGRAIATGLGRFGHEEKALGVLHGIDVEVDVAGGPVQVVAVQQLDRTSARRVRRGIAMVVLDCPHALELAQWEPGVAWRCAGRTERRSTHRGSGRNGQTSTPCLDRDVKKMHTCSVVPRLAVERFHLTFCRLLCAGADRGDFAIKGGCNLRFFFGSVRYSEDVDLDVQRVPQRTLLGRVNKLLEGPALSTPLRAVGIHVASVSTPKQTETTQRWTIALTVPGSSVPVPTKVEFSRREAIRAATVEPLDFAFAAEHRTQPVLLPHYPAAVAVVQKVRALAGRTEVQARDVFDLSVLFARLGDPSAALQAARTLLPAGVSRAMEISYDDYAGQVVPYLEPVHAESFGSRAAWDALQLQVVEALERAQQGA